MKTILLILLFTPISLLAQLDLNQLETKKYTPPTLWSWADGMEGFDSYCVFKSSIDKNLYLIGFDSEGDENLKLLVQQVTFNDRLDECTIIQNGTEIRLRGRIQ